MKFGFFDDKNKEYVITSPKTPYPWINYLGCEDFFALCSNTAGGYHFYKDARLRRLTRYRYNNVPIDVGARAFYINDGKNIWCPAWSPVKTELDFYECRHGMGYTEICGKKEDLSAKITLFVPVGYNCEVQKIVLKNESSENKKFTFFSFAEWCLWDANDDSTNFQRNFSTGEVEIKDNIIYHKTEYKERRNHYAFYGVNCEATGYDTDREAFVGLYNGLDKPDCVLNGKSKNSIADGWSTIASHSFDIELAPNEEKTLVFVLGYVENEKEEKFESKNIINKKKALEISEAFSTAKKADKALDELKSYWNKLLSKINVNTPDERFDRMVNIWNQYQCMVTFNMSRSASLFESGIGRGMGFRDSNQDLLGFVHQIPEKARQRILDLASTMLPDGGAYHQYQPLSKRGNNDIGEGFNDDPLWMILAVSAYLKETGDFGILDEKVPYDNNEELSDTILDHLKRAFDHVINNAGPHGLPLIGRADWNDCLNLNCFSDTPGEPFQTTTSKDGKVAESVMIAGMFTFIGPQYAEICKMAGNESESIRAESEVEKMKKIIMEHGFDGEWFLRAYDDFGKKIGSHENEEGKIFIESQGFCVMSGLGKDDGKAQKTLDSIDKYLNTKYGLVLQNPAFTKYYIEYGEISTYPAGYKENAGIFCHNNAWIICAEAYCGRGDKAYEYYSKIAPAFLEDISDIHRTEPYVYAQMIAGKDAKRFGEAKNSWLTGTAAWNFVAASQYILGISAEFNGLKINPSIPHEWDGFTATREFRNAVYEITVKNPDNISNGVKSILVDGNIIEGLIVPEFGDGKVHTVEVIMG